MTSETPVQSEEMEVFLERIKDAVRKGGASDADVERLERLFSRETTFLDLTNEEAGSWLRWFARSAYDSWARQHPDQDEVNMRLGLTMLGVLQLLKQAYESNAATLNLTLESVKLNDEPTGDWQINIKHLTGEGIDISELN